jgi:hypothetical protein
MNFSCEVARKNQHFADADALLYTPIQAELRYKQSRVYHFDYEGDYEALRGFVKEVLVDEVSQELRETGVPLEKDALFHLDYGMKPGALDLEKEAIMQYYRSRSGTANSFQLKKLEISQRVSIFGSGDKDMLVTKFVKDIVNPAIHKYIIH